MSCFSMALGVSDSFVSACVVWIPLDGFSFILATAQVRVHFVEYQRRCGRSAAATQRLLG